MEEFQGSNTNNNFHESPPIQYPTFPEEEAKYDVFQQQLDNEQE